MEDLNPPKKKTFEMGFERNFDRERERQRINMSEQERERRELAGGIMMMEEEKNPKSPTREKVREGENLG